MEANMGLVSAVEAFAEINRALGRQPLAERRAEGLCRSCESGRYFMAGRWGCWREGRQETETDSRGEVIACRGYSYGGAA